MNSNAVYVLKPNLKDPRFDGFVYAEHSPSVLGNEDGYGDLRLDDTESLDWRQKSLQAVWKPLPVAGVAGKAVNAFNDYPCLELVRPVFSRRAVEALGEMLTDNGELLPLKTNDGEYYVYLCMTKLDAINVSKSKIIRPSRTSTAFDIEYFAFKKARLVGASIFRVRELPNHYLVTEQFKKRPEEAALNGLDFFKVWPLPEDSDWVQERAAWYRQNKRVTLLGQALTICFQLKNTRPSAGEKASAAKIEKALSDKLLPSTVQEKYWGTVEKTEFSDGEFRIICTCPDCDELAEFLDEWLQKVRWHGGVAIVKRYGNLYWGRPKHRRVEIPRVGKC